MIHYFGICSVCSMSLNTVLCRLPVCITYSRTACDSIWSRW